MHEHAPGEERFDAAAQAAQWETRYSERDGARWSGRPNGRLVAEVGDLGDEPPVRSTAPHRTVTFAVPRVPLRGLCWRAEPPFVVFVLVHVQHYAAR